MASYEQVLKFENETPQGVLRYALLHRRGRASSGNSERTGALPPRPCLGRPSCPCCAVGWLASCLGLCAERCGLFIEREAVLTKEMARGRVSAHGKRRDVWCVGEARENEQTVGGELARVFGRRVVARRQRTGHQFDEAGLGRCLEALQQRDFAGRDKAARHNPAMLGLFDDLGDGGLVFGERFLEGEAGVQQKGRAEQCQVAHGAPAAVGVENRVADVGETHEAVGVGALPKHASGVKFDVVAKLYNRPQRGSKPLGALTVFRFKKGI